MKSTRDPEYTSRLLRLEKAWWKRCFDVQAPYRWNLRRLEPGFTLEVGCGVGRNLAHLRGNAVGVDHNPTSIEAARSRQLIAYTPTEFRASKHCLPGSFDSLLLSHVAEHLSAEELAALLLEYAPFIKPDGKLILITPQEAGYRSDASHVRFLGFEELRAAAREAGFEPVLEFSFPFPRPVGRLFLYNEFISVSRRTRASS
ncbi:MAG: methyltransferase domain-containing protein [Oligoflexia bacterium]|nr:methyltransferase domain-containing protein [Oligoflexia bacterium]